jgi:phosphate uptake regulator
MREASKANISSIMDSEAQNKSQQVQRLQEITSNIDRVLEKSKNHVATMTKANAVFQQYMPIYKAKIAALESGIVDMGQQSLSFVDASREIIDEMTDEKVALVEKYDQ